MRPSVRAVHELVDAIRPLDELEAEHKRATLAWLLGAHRNAGLWLPPGGHVEPDEHPAETARREAREELGIDPVFAAHPPRPLLVTVTETVGVDPRARRRQPVVPAVRSRVREEPASRFDPHLARFLAKAAPSGQTPMVSAAV